MDRSGVRTRWLGFLAGRRKSNGKGVNTEVTESTERTEKGKKGEARLDFQSRKESENQELKTDH
jgi:hypothetical protein